MRYPVIFAVSLALVVACTVGKTARAPTALLNGV